LQAAIPLFICLVVLIAVAVVRKYGKTEVFVICLALFAAGLTSVFVPLSPFAAVQGTEVGEITNSDVASLALAQQYMVEGDYNKAAEVLDELQKSNADDKEVLLAKARCSLLLANFNSAKLLYDSLDSAPKKEVEMVNALAAASSYQNYGAIAHQIKEDGGDPTKYGFKTASKSAFSYEDAKKTVTDSIKSNLEKIEKDYGEEFIRGIKNTISLNRYFDSFLADGYCSDIQDVKNGLNELKEMMEEESDLLSNSHMRAARLRGNAIIGDYADIAEMADENVSPEEAIILSELYLRGYIKEEDFSDSFVKTDLERREAVLDACSETLKKKRKDLSEEEYSKYHAVIDALKEGLERPAFAIIKEGIQKEAKSGRSVLKSKCFLALAKIEQSRGNKDKTSSYLSDALHSAQDSDDENYRLPMGQMLSVIQGNSQSSEVKNIAKYVDSALDNALPLDVQIITPPVEIVDGENSNDSTEENSDQYGDTNQDNQNPDEDGNKKDKQTDTTAMEYNEEEFRGEMTEIVSQGSATMNIGVINKDEFPDVKARIQIQSSKWSSFDEIKRNLIVFDCGSYIQDFTLEKLEFKRSNIILLCDISGSMNGNIPQLHEAVTSFADKMLPGEKVAVVGFDSDIVFIEEFTADPEKVKKAADKLYDGGGGTALYSSLVECLEQMKADINANNIVIAMTDGQDGDSVGEGEMYQTINGLCAKNGITVYTLGLGGSVNTDYLEHMATCGNGSFLYIETIEDLESFYDFIHGMLHNQYILSYTAKNRTKNERKLEISMNEEMGNAQKTYYLVDPVYTDEGKDAYNPYVVEDVKLLVNGLNTKFLYKSSQDHTVSLKGNGFDEGDDIDVRLVGNVRYQLKAKFVDKKTYEITIPTEVSVGTYDLSVSVAGSNFELKSELTIAAYGTEKTFTFGSYTFTALSSYVNENENTVLSGNVTMNNWLRFKGDIEISGNYNNAEMVSITDRHGVYISYSTSVAHGLAYTMADWGLPVSFPALGTFNIYSQRYDPSDYKNFRTSDIEVGAVINMATLIAENPSVSVYPDMLELQVLNVGLDLPFQEQIMKGFGKETLAKFKAKSEVQILVGATSVGLNAEVSYSDGADYDEKVTGEFVFVSLPLKLSKLELSINTMENDYSISAGVAFKALKDMEAGLEFGFEVDGGKFESVYLQTDGVDVPLMETPVPISIGNFGIELAGFSKYESNQDTLSKALGTKVTSKFEVDCGKLKTKFPKIAKLLDAEDAALASLKDCELSLQLKELRILFDADVELFGVLDIGECSVSLGCFDYTNALIGYYNEDEVGLRVKLTAGIDWKTGELKMQAQGSAEAVLGMPYSGLWLNGKANFEVGWWIFRTDFDVSGDVLLGVYKNSSDNLQFSAIVRGVNSKGEYSGFHAYVTKATGFDVYSY